jgi:aldose 1-epimerase|tara:strand:- start:216 stop:488 length:273 start_codon:yes stop_codon:yes gene_type:complete
MSGNLAIRVRFALVPDQPLSVDTSAQCDVLTWCNYAHHSYFNLAEVETIAGYILEAAADEYLVVNEAGMPTGEMRRVKETAFDFRTAGCW